MTEAELQRLVTDVATLRGWRVYHTFDSRRSTPGFPDLVLCRPPRVIFLELKSETGRVRPEQREWLDALERCDTLSSGVIRPADVDRLLARL